MKTFYTTSSFYNWIFAFIVNGLLIWVCSLFAQKLDWKYLDMAFFLYLIILLFYFICLKIDEGIPALFRKFVLRRKFLLLHVSAYEVTIILVAVYHIARAIVLYRDSINFLF